jgi:pimeloyl-ACP methyl ester carboxylesterase
VIRRGLLAAAAIAVPIASLDVLSRRASRRLLAGPRTLPEEAALGPALDALGGEVVRLRSRDGLRLAGRWLVGEGEDPAWVRDPHEAILLMHGWSGSVAPDLVEYGPFLRRTAGVLGLDFRGHGGSDDGPTTFGLREVEDVAGALAWLGERGIERVALFGTSLGGITALAAVAVLGDGSLAGVDMDPAAPAHVAAPRRPRIVAVVADSVAPELAVAVGSRMPGAGLPEGLRRRVAGRLFSSAARTLGADPRDTEPIRIIGLLEGVPLLLVAGDADLTVPIADARRLAAAAPATAEFWEVAGADHAGSHRADPAGYEARITGHLRPAFLDGRSLDL